MVYMLGILLVASRFGRWPSLAASVLSVLALDFFFVPPSFSFAVGNLKHLATFAVMLLVGLVIGNLTERIRSQARLARTRENRHPGPVPAFRRADPQQRLRRPWRNRPSATWPTHFQSKVSIFLPGRRRAAWSPSQDPKNARRGPGRAGRGPVGLRPPRAGRPGHRHPARRPGPVPAPEGRPRPHRRHGHPAPGRRPDAWSRTSGTSWRPSPTRPPWPWSGPSWPSATASPSARWTGSSCATPCSPRSPTTCARPWAASPAPPRTLLEDDGRPPPDGPPGPAGDHPRGGQPAAAAGHQPAGRHPAGIRRGGPGQGLGAAWRRWWARPWTAWRAQLAGREVKVELPANLPMVQADPVLLGQVVINLLENANKFSPARPAHRDQGLGHGARPHPAR